MNSPLVQFFYEPKNTHAREAILMHRLFYDMQLAAARCGYYLNSYFDDVDHDGFDVIFDDQNQIKKIQVKSIGVDAKTSAWKIHKKLLCPSKYFLSCLGFSSEGTEGGVVLIEFSGHEDSLEVNYYYTDIFVLMAFDCEIIRRKSTRSQKAVKDCVYKLECGEGGDVVSVPRAAFIKAKDVDSLLALIGFVSRISTTWKHNVIRVTNHTRPFADRSLELPDFVSAPELSRVTVNEILELTDDQELKPA